MRNWLPALVQLPLESAHPHTRRRPASTQRHSGHTDGQARGRPQDASRACSSRVPPARGQLAWEARRGCSVLSYAAFCATNRLTLVCNASPIVQMASHRRATRRVLLLRVLLLLLRGSLPPSRPGALPPRRPWHPGRPLRAPSPAYYLPARALHPPPSIPRGARAHPVGYPCPHTLLFGTHVCTR